MSLTVFSVLIVNKKIWMFVQNIFRVTFNYNLKTLPKLCYLNFEDYSKPCYFAHSLFLKESTEPVYHLTIFILRKQPVNGLLLI